MNIFIEHIYNKKKFGLKQYIKYRKFLKQLKVVMPTFGMLWQIADFIKILEKVYFYDNNVKQESGLFSSLKYKDGENGFCVYAQGVTIVYKLYQNTEKISIEIQRSKGNQIKSEMTFDSSTQPVLDTLDENLLINTTDLTMNATIDLLKTYYKNKKV